MVTKVNSVFLTVLIGFFLIGFLTVVVACNQNTAGVASKKTLEEEASKAESSADKAAEKAQTEKTKIEEAKKTAEKALEELPVLVGSDMPSGDEFAIMNFDSGDKPNNIGGDLGAWDKDPADDTQTCTMSFQAGDDALGNANGYSLRLDYDVDSPNPAYNGFWSKLEGEDFSNYSTLNFYLRGDDAKGFTKRLKIELKDYNGAKAVYVASNINPGWQRYSIPFEQFGGSSALDWSAMGEFVIVFDDTTSDPKVGSILLDQVTVS